MREFIIYLLFYLLLDLLPFFTSYIWGGSLTNWISLIAFDSYSTWSSPIFL